MKIQTINELNAYFDPGVGHAKGRGSKIRNRSEMIVCTNDNIKKIVNQEIERLGNNADLNHLDVSRVTDMSYLFSQLKFNGDISQWNTSNVQYMNNMFRESEFNGDISNWDTHNVTTMACMFYYSKFNQDISKWDVSNVNSMSYMFYGSDFNQDISKWNVQSLKIADHLFDNHAKFAKCINSWEPKLRSDIELF